MGLAISDPGGSFALPLAVLERSSDSQVIGEIRALAEREQIGLLVVGEPRTPAGEAGAAAARARRFAARLARACALPTLMVEETLTTVEAASRRTGSASPAPGRRRRGHDAADRTDASHSTAALRAPHGLDALAAQVILQEALDRGLAGGPR